MSHSKGKDGDKNGKPEMEGNFAKRLMEIYADGEQPMEISMDIDMEVQKEVVDEKAVQFSRKIDDSNLGVNLDISAMFVTPKLDESANLEDAASARKTRIQNISMLCGNHRELTHHVRMPTPPSKKKPEAYENNSTPFLLNEEHVSESLIKESLACKLSSLYSIFSFRIY